MSENLTRDLINTRELNYEYIKSICEKAIEFYKNIIEGNERYYKHILDGWNSVPIFMEKSTRTHDSFIDALTKMGARQDIGISAPEKSSLGKGETLADTIDTYVGYGANFIVIRDPREGSSRWAKICALKSFAKRIREYASKNRKFPPNITLPVILNGGDGSNNHPSQHLLDCATMKYFLERFDNLNIGIINDIGASRVFSSQIDTAKILNWKIYLCKNPGINISERNMQRIKDTGVEIKEFENFEEYCKCFKDLDVLYAHRFQKNLREGEISEQDIMQKISKDLLEKNGFRKDAIVMHARPVDKEVKEISDCLRYHQWNKSGIQSDFGIPTRMAIAHYIIEKRLFSLEEIIKIVKFSDFNYFKQDIAEIPPKSKTREEYTTAFIKNGYVIDHIPIGCGSKIHEMISKMYPEATVILSSNVNSERKNYKRKDVIKIHGKIEWNNKLDGLISIFTDPDEEKSCRISYFQNGKRKNKWTLKKIADSSIKELCNNEKCISKEENKEGIHILMNERKDRKKECPLCNYIQ